MVKIIKIRVRRILKGYYVLYNQIYVRINGNFHVKLGAAANKSDLTDWKSYFEILNNVFNTMFSICMCRKVYHGVA